MLSADLNNVGAGFERSSGRPSLNAIFRRHGLIRRTPDIAPLEIQEPDPHPRRLHFLFRRIIALCAPCRCVSRVEEDSTRISVDGSGS